MVKKKSKVSRRKKVTPPTPHRTGVTPPKLDPKQIPNHVALVMDGNGRWAKQRGLPRTAGHEAGEASLLDMVHGAIEIGVKELSAYAFSTENWRRSPEEVKFLMEFNRQVLPGLNQLFRRHKTNQAPKAPLLALPRMERVRLALQKTLQQDLLNKFPSNPCDLLHI